MTSTQVALRRINVRNAMVFLLKDTLPSAQIEP